MGVVVARSEVRADARCAAQIVVVGAMVCMMDVSDRASLPRVCGRVDVCGRRPSVSVVVARNLEALSYHGYER